MDRVASHTHTHTADLQDKSTMSALKVQRKEHHVTLPRNADDHTMLYPCAWDCESRLSPTGDRDLRPCFYINTITRSDTILGCYFSIKMKAYLTLRLIHICRSPRHCKAAPWRSSVFLSETNHPQNSHSWVRRSRVEAFSTLQVRQLCPCCPVITGLEISYS